MQGHAALGTRRCCPQFQEDVLLPRHICIAHLVNTICCNLIAASKWARTRHNARQSCPSPCNFENLVKAYSRYIRYYPPMRRSYLLRADVFAFSIAFITRFAGCSSCNASSLCGQFWLLGVLGASQPLPPSKLGHQKSGPTLLFNVWKSCDRVCSRVPLLGARSRPEHLSQNLRRERAAPVPISDAWRTGQIREMPNRPRKVHAVERREATVPCPDRHPAREVCRRRRAMPCRSVVLNG